MLRDERESDLPFLRALYASTRADELAPTGWSDEQKRSFTDAQFELQHAQYLQAYARGEWLLIVCEGEDVGRIYVDASFGEVRLIDIALLPPARNAGLGTRITRALLAWADALGKPASLHVEPFNPAYRMYVREGFVYQRTQGYCHLLLRAVGARASDAPLSSPWRPS